MKKCFLILCLATASIFATGVMAATTTPTQAVASNIDIYTAVGVIFSSFGDAIWNLITSKTTASLLTVFLTIAYFLDPVVEKVSWTPANRVLAFLWWFFKKVLGFLASKKSGTTGATPSASATPN